MYTIFVLTLSSIKGFARNRQALFFTIFTPLIIIFLFGFIGFDRPPKFDVGLVAGNPNVPTKEFIDHLKEFPIFTIHEGARDAEMKELDAGNRAVVLEVPDDFMPTAALAPGATPKQIIANTNAGQSGQAQTVLSVLNQYLDKTTLTIVKAPSLFKVTENQVNAHNLRYIDFLLPGLVALSVMQMSVFSVAFVFTQLKEKGVLKRLLATPMRPSQFVTANVITRLIVAVVQTAIFIIVGALVFHTQIIGAYWLILLCVILGALMFLGLGFTISGLSKTVDSVPAIANLVVFPMLFLGGTFFPISSMPNWLRHIAEFLPLTYFSTALREVMTKAATIGDIKWSLLGMLVWAVILITLSTITFSFQEKDN